MVKKELKEPEKDHLIVTKDMATAKLQMQVEAGEIIAALPVKNDAEVKQALIDMRLWIDFTKEVLLRIFSTNKMEQEFAWAHSTIYANPLDNFRRIDSYLNKLKSILKRVDLYDDIVVPGKLVTIKVANKSINSKDVFIVHGTDEANKDKLARYLEKLKLKAIILHEQPNQGKTIIEKLEHHSEVAFVVILLTPDDIGGSSSQLGKLLPRARQNVIFELGYFIGKLGRERVCALYDKGVEPPSDFSGIVYIPLENEDTWKLLLAKEIKAAGIDIDLNDAIS